ncbi:MAG TPA: hypothetical protein P5230_02590 [Candidatus Magasanikbacteria bacterium]|nr:hypothetical protein [Candidatus Magasanikbacteria bacterium]
MKKTIIIFIITFLFSGLFYSFVNAQTASPAFQDSKEKMDDFATKLSFSGFDASTSNIIKGAMFLVNTLFFIFMIYAGVLWLISSGDEGKIEKAKTIIFWCVVGLAVTLSAYSITMFVLGKVQ